MASYLFILVLYTDFIMIDLCFKLIDCLNIYIRYDGEIMIEFHS